MEKIIENELKKSFASPILKQFNDLKRRYPDNLILLRVGDFYETYNEDAQTASKILGITLTVRNNSRTANGNHHCIAGFPYHAIDIYLPKLIRAGQCVSICNYIEASICNKCAYGLTDGKCNRLITSGGFGNNDHLASDYKKDNSCKWFAEGENSRNNNYTMWNS